MMRVDFSLAQATESLRLQYVQEDPRRLALLEQPGLRQQGRLLRWARWRLCDVGWGLVAAGVWLENHSQPARAGLSAAA